jgi:hypothetical protein
VQKGCRRCRKHFSINRCGFGVLPWYVAPCRIRGPPDCLPRACRAMNGATPAARGTAAGPILQAVARCTPAARRGNRGKPCRPWQPCRTIPRYNPGAFRAAACNPCRRSWYAIGAGLLFCFRVYDHSRAGRQTRPPPLLCIRQRIARETAAACRSLPGV